MADINDILKRIQPLKQRLLKHSVYSNLTGTEGLKIFMEYHVFAVWDFMSLLKCLQKELTCTTYPWMPRADPEIRGFINKIVLGEESDEYKGSHISHYELYLEAMKQCGASVQNITDFTAQLNCGMPMEVALRARAIPPAVKDFVKTTFDIIEEGKPHAVAAAFTFGREDLIPDMFRALIADMDKRFPGQYDTFKYYVNRHIEVSGDEHGPISLRMLQKLCGSDKQKWQEALDASIRSLEARDRMWNAVEADVLAKAAAGKQ